jgi:hypothetical protein
MIDLASPALSLAGAAPVAARPPKTYAEAKAWLTARHGFHIVTEHDEVVLVAVAVRGRGAEAVAASRSDADVSDAFLRAVRSVVTKL